MTQSLLHDQENGFVVRCFSIQHAMRQEADTGQARGKNICFRGTPQHRAGQPGQNAGGEQGGAGIPDSAADFMHCGQGQPLRRQMRIHLLYAKRQYPGMPGSRTLQQANAVPQRLKNMG